MDELEKGLEISLSGQQRDRILSAFLKQMEEWQIALPPVEPLVLDFGLGNFSEFGLIEYWIANEMQAGYCGKYLFLFDGQTCPQHRHAGKHETFFVVKGTMRIKHGHEVMELGAGDVLPVNPGNYHSFTGVGPVLLLELSMPCEIDDNEFVDPRIPIGKSDQPSNSS